MESSGSRRGVRADGGMARREGHTWRQDACIPSGALLPGATPDVGVSVCVERWGGC